MAIRSLGSFLSAGIVASWLSIVSPHVEAQPAVQLDLPAQPLADALRLLGKRADTNILIDLKLVGNLQAAAVKGTLTVDQALEQMLLGTNLRYRFINERTVVLESTKAGVGKTSEVTQAADLRLAQSGDENTSMQRVNPALQSGEKESSISEIIVTATKRTERLQDVPVSISVVTAEDIERRGLVGAADYLRGMPGANQVEAAPSQSIIIRGMETQAVYQGTTGGETTGTYFGEAPTTGSAGFVSSSVDIKLVDIERIEVLRGPQGTTFGSGSLGGVVRTIPVAPKLDRFEAKMSAGYSVTSENGDDNHNLQAIGNIPLVRDKLAIRAVVYEYQDSGFYRNRAGSNAAFQSTVVTPYGAQAFATNDEDVGSYHVVGGRIAALWQATDDLKLSLSYLTQKAETDGIPVAMTGSYEQTVLRVAPEHVRRGQQLGLIDTDIDVANAVLEYDLQWADLLASYSHVKGGSEYMRPLTSIGVNHARSQAVESPHRGDVGELRLATKFEGPWNFLAGVYTESVDDDYVFNAIWFGDVTTSPYLPRGVGRNLGDSLLYFEQKQKAAFGEVSWEFLQNLTLTLGARVSEFDTKQATVGSGLYVPATNEVRTLEASKTTTKANLSYQPNKNVLVYAGYSEGFRIGRPTDGVAEALCDANRDGVYDGTQIGAIRALDSDTIDSYEIGTKFALMDGRLRTDAAVFRMDWIGIPVIAVLPPAPISCGVSYSVNAGEARSEGIELQANFQIADAVRLDFGGSWMDARLTKDLPPQGWSSGDQLPGSPAVSANLGIQYEFPIGRHNAFVRADSIYVGPFHSLIGQELEAGDYVKLDATARVAIGNLNIDLFVRNLTNEDAFTFHSPLAVAGLGNFFGYQLRPRTVGFQLGYNF